MLVAHLDYSCHRRAPKGDGLIVPKPTNQAVVMVLALTAAILGGCSDPKVPVVQSSAHATASASATPAATEITCYEFSKGTDGGDVDINDWTVAVYAELAAERGITYDASKYSVGLKMLKLKLDVAGYCEEPRNWEASARSAAQVLVDANPKDYWPEMA